MSRAERKSLRLLTLCALYFAQGIPWGFTTITIPAYLGSLGMTPAAIGVALAMNALPFALKWVWGPIIDGVSLPRFGRRRPWIIVAQLMMALTIVALLGVHDPRTQLSVLGGILFIHTAFSALQDVAVDALAIDILEPHERGRANGFMNAARYVGGIIGGAGLSFLLVQTSGKVAIIVLALLLIAVLPIPWMVRERAPSSTARLRLDHVIRSLAIVFSLRSAVVTALLMLVLTFTLGLLSANAFALFTQQLGWSPDRYAQLTGGFSMVAGFVGAVVGGQLVDRFGRRSTMAVASVAMGLGWLLFGLLDTWWSVTPFVYAMALFEQVCTSVMLVSIFALCMDVSWSPTAATQFTAYIAISNFSGSLGYRFTAVASTWFDFAGAYLFAAAIQIAVPVLLLFIDPGQTARELPLPDGTPIPRRGIAAVIVLAIVLVALTAYIVSGLW